MQCRETVSAGWDGETGPLTAEQAAAHLDGCADCRRWEHAASEVTRALRVRPVEAVPDLSSAILAAATEQGLSRPRPVRASSAGRWRLDRWRVVLGLIAVAQLLLGFGQLLGLGGSAHTGHMGMAMDDHLFNESTAWNIAIGAGFAAAALRPRLASGLLPMLQVFLLVLAGVSVADLVRGDATVGRVSSHALVVVGVLVLWWVNATYRRTPRPGQRRPETDQLHGTDLGSGTAPGSLENPDVERAGHWLRPAGRKAA